MQEDSGLSAWERKFITGIICMILVPIIVFTCIPWWICRLCGYSIWALTEWIDNAKK